MKRNTIAIVVLILGLVLFALTFLLARYDLQTFGPRQASYDIVAGAIAAFVCLLAANKIANTT